MIEPEIARHRERAFAPDHNQAIQSEDAKILLQSLHQLFIFERIETRSAKNRAAPRQYSKNRLSGQLDVIVLHQAAPTIFDAGDVTVIRRSTPDDCPNSSIKPGTIAASGKNSYCHV